MGGQSKVFIIKGDKKNLEVAEHIIEFPGGSICVCRTSGNEYWAHIAVNHDQVDEYSTKSSKHGEIIHSRLDYDFPEGIEQIKEVKGLRHIAVRIKTKNY